MSVLVQESLLDVSDEPVLGSLGGSVRRTTLARGAWVDLRRGWLTGSGVVFGRLVARMPMTNAARFLRLPKKDKKNTKPSCNANASRLSRLARTRSLSTV